MILYLIILVAWIALAFGGWLYFGWLERDADRRIERARKVAFDSAILLSEKPEQVGRWTDEDIADYERHLFSVKV